MTFYLLFVDDFGDEEVVVLFLEVVQSLFCCGLFLELLYLHLVVVKLVTLWIAILKNCLKTALLMHGGLKSNANLYGTNPLGGPDFFPFPPYFLPTAFYFSSLLIILHTRALEMKSNSVWLVQHCPSHLPVPPCFSRTA